MPIDLKTETLRPLVELIRSKSIPGARGRRLHLSTLVRWITNGVRGPDGGRVRLEAIRVGARWLTSDEALQRFADRLTPRLEDPPAPSPTPTPARRRRAAERATAELERLGI